MKATPSRNRSYLEQSAAGKIQLFRLLHCLQISDRFCKNLLLEKFVSFFPWCTGAHSKFYLTLCFTSPSEQHQIMRSGKLPARTGYEPGGKLDVSEEGPV